jgi:hypothetical protein
MFGERGVSPLLLTCPTGLSGPRLVAALVAAGADPHTIARQTRPLLGGLARIDADNTGKLRYTGEDVLAAVAAATLRTRLGPGGPTVDRAVRALTIDRGTATVAAADVAAIVASTAALDQLGWPNITVCGPLPDNVSAATRARLHQWGFYPAGASGAQVDVAAGVLLDTYATWQPALPAGALAVAVLREADSSPADLGALTVWRTSTATRDTQPTRQTVR